MSEKKSENCSSDTIGIEKIKEGKAEILFESGKVFYNPVQVKNRDLSVLVLNEFSKVLLHETNDQKARKAAGSSWRRIPMTVDTWPIEKNLERDGDIQGMAVLEALGASGLRSIRYINEVIEGVGISHLCINDLEKEAVESINKNLKHNGLADDRRILVSKNDANELMFSHRFDGDRKVLSRAKALVNEKLYDFDPNCDTYDVIDIDPYGTPATFIDTALQSVRDGGLLCITATDLPALCGKDADVCYSRYGAFSLRSNIRAPHDMAIRILLGCIERTAMKYGRVIVPILSVHFDFYVRVFIRVYMSKNDVLSSSEKCGFVFQSRGCDSFYIQPMGEQKLGKSRLRAASLKVPSKCEETGQDLAMCGPIWIGPIHNQQFVKSLLKYFDQSNKHDLDMTSLGSANMVHGKLVAISEEIDAPLAYSMTSIAKTLHCQAMKYRDFQAALINAGYKASRSQSDPNCIKTDAPPSVVWDILRFWVKKHPTNQPHKILETEPSLQVDFTWPEEIVKSLRDDKEKVTPARFAPNPEAHWGPKRRAAGSGSKQTHKRKKSG